MRTFLVPALALSLLGLVATGAGCAAPGDDDVSESQDELRALKITEAENGKTFTVEKGQAFSVTLESNPTTGYAWKVVSTPPKLGYPSPQDGVYVGGGGSGSRVGSGGTQVFTWKTDSATPRATAYPVTLEYRRSSDREDAPAAKTFKFKIKLKDGATPPPPEPTNAVVVSEEHNGAAIQATDGEAVVIRLPENATSASRWNVVNHGALDAPEKTSQGGTAIFTLKTANMVGTHPVALAYSAANGAASQTFKITLNVVAAGDSNFECPPAFMRTIDCQPPTNRKPHCERGYRTWAQANCQVTFVD